MLKVSHFDTRPYRVINAKESQDFHAFIDAVEARVLKKLLGVEMYNELIAGLAVEPAEDIELKWLALRDGDTYLYNEKTYEYVGLVELLKPYVFSEWVRETHTKFTTVGVVRTEADHTKPVNPSARIVEAYNDYVAKVGSSLNVRGTLYGFLNHGDYTYETLHFTQPFALNKFGI